MNNDFGVTRWATCKWFSLVTSSLVKIIGKSSHSWPKTVIHDNPCVMLYLLIRIGISNHHKYSCLFFISVVKILCSRRGEEQDPMPISKYSLNLIWYVQLDPRYFRPCHSWNPQNVLKSYCPELNMLQIPNSYRHPHVFSQKLLLE